MVNLIGQRRSASTSPTLVRVQTEQGVLAAEADAEGPAGRGGALGVGHLHEVDVTVGGDKVGAAQRVGATAGLPEGGPDLVSQLLSKLDGKRGDNAGNRDTHTYTQTVE